jgi:hypothetical protein
MPAAIHCFANYRLPAFVLFRHHRQVWGAGKLVWRRGGQRDDVVFVEALSYGATGKIQKMELRRRFAGHYSPAARSTA